MHFPIAAVRARLPALAVTDGRRPRIHFDAPGDTQACAEAIDAMAEHLRTGTAILGGRFATSAAMDALNAEAHAAMANLLDATPARLPSGRT